MAKKLWAAAIAGLLLALLAGCVNNGAGSDNDDRNGFYGGIIGGGTRP